MTRSTGAARLYAFRCGSENTVRALLDPFDSHCGDIVSLPYFFYLIRHPEGDVLFDCGAHPQLAVDPRARIGAAADQFDVALGPEDNVSAQLATLGLEADAIQHAVQSHLHYDHAGGLEFLPNATVYVQELELPFAEHPPVYQQSSYVSADFDRVKNWRRLAGEFDLFNDSQVVIFPTPGHTPGHQSLLVKLQGGSIILVGDAAFDHEKMTHRCLPGMLWSPDAVIASWDRIEDMQRRHEAQLILTHDLGWRENIKLAPSGWYE
jgi:glyoxylase-like metal-dependent hydrolase (beta-lactamase superfamily II)